MQNLATLLYEAAEECGCVDSLVVDRILNMASLKATLKKTTEQPSGNLTPRQIVRLAAAIPDNKMASVAKRYMNIPSETIENIRE